jgi:hypothetical protein
MVSWYGILGQFAGGSAAAGRPTAENFAAVEGILTMLGSLGLRGIRFEEFAAQAERELGENAATMFEEGLKKLGTMLGWEGSRPGEAGAPDSVWRIPGFRTIVIEAKSEEKPDHGISKDTSTEAQGHAAWVEARLGASRDETSVVVVSPREAIHSVAKPQSKGLFHQTPDEMRKLLREVIALLRDLRTNLADTDSEAAAEEVLTRIQRAKLTPEEIVKRLLSRSFETMPVRDS